MKRIEIELRGLLNKSSYQSLKNRLDVEADFLEDDNRETYFFVIPGINFKISNCISQNKAKIALKDGKESNSVNEEIEIQIMPEELENAKKIFNRLGFTKMNLSKQIRRNYTVRGINISLKWSQDWGYHFEIDSTISSSKNLQSRKQELENFAKELGLTTLSNEEMQHISEKINTKHKLD